MTRIVLGVEYDGGGFSGWQWQPDKRSIQQTLEQALSKVAAQPVTVTCAGRTDAGVHAFEQVVHFDVEAKRDLHAWMLGGNSNLPHDVKITWVKTAVGDFHARYSAVARFYRYIILNRPAKPALQYGRATWCYNPLDADKMHQAAQYLIGNHDFSSFRAQGCQSKSPWRIMHFIDVYRRDDQVIMDISANAFLHHMVRNIAGVLMAIGMGKQSVDWTRELLEVKSRKLGGITAPPDGLYLGAVYYPEHYGIAKHPVFDKLPADAKRFD
ncbi:MAG: tRNA pseudouridine(38-40) synthase TruA [Methylobacter sp.]|uniref:tRNA pseudouridine(38-40) synthase TruA n=1 Tax=Methylobacter sp. TaxID=2051955 RepID=UPI0025907CB2|nr:tRNA pseudouridine(38-40) synthase TruA [Methylobacter sp.]MCL7420515.1 tRNA pseudouridine(38-40) synthase TruA [Methylobacter sp.]